MAIKTTPIISNKLYLQDYSEEIQALEEGEDKAQWAWVMIRQATESDNLRRGDLRSKVIFQFDPDGNTKQEQSTNFRELAAFEVFLTLSGAGNFIGVHEEELFTFIDTGPYPKYAGDFKMFESKYGLLPEAAAEAIIRAMWTINRNWNWMSDSPITETEGEV